MPSIELRNRAGEVIAHALVDEEDYELVAQFRWCLDGGYAGRRVWRGNGQYERIKMHRLILGLVTGDPRHVDHINRDRLDNHRQNLRVVAGRAENAQNRPSWGASRFRGVTWHKRVGRWQSRVKLNGVTHHLGYFDSEEEAGVVAAAQRAALLEYATD